LVAPILLRFVRLAGMWDILSMKINKDVLINSPLFKGMSVYQIKKTILLSQLHELKSQETVIKQGEKTSNMFLVISGKIEIVREDGSKEIKIQIINPGEVFGEVAFTGKIERTATARALEPSEVISLDSNSIEKSLRFYPNIGKKLFENICTILSLRLAQTNKHLSK
jgi:CRP-like cAMP-binding protein